MAQAPEKTALVPAMHSGGKIAPIVPTSWQEVVQIASMICRANMAPKSYLDKDGNANPDKVAIAIMHGLEVGFTPMAALQSIAVINGMPSIYGDGLLALIRASGLLEDIEETMEWGKDGPVSATCKMWRKGEKTPSIQTYTRDDAIEARLWGKSGPWTDHKPRMLQWRARGWCGRDKFADVLRGLRLAEEVQDMVDVTTQGSATVSPVEPSRDDPKYQSQPDAPPSQGAPVESGQPATSPPAGAGSVRTPEAASRPAPKPKPKPKPNVDSKSAESESNAAPEQPAAAGVTDVVDQNATGEAEPEFGPQRPRPGEKLEFQRYSKVYDFANFADHFLPRTNAEGAAQFEAMYEGTLVAMERSAKKASNDAAKEYRATLAAFRASGREPGKEG